MIKEWPMVLRRYLLASIGLHFTWEILQLPFYTLWRTAPLREQAFAIVHCTVGDAMIAGLSLLVCLSVLARPTWPASQSRMVWLAVIGLGIGYTVFSEWLNVSVRSSWSYSTLMPTLPILGTGLTPLLQWLVVPTAALWISYDRRPWTHEQLAIDEDGAAF